MSRIITLTGTVGTAPEAKHGKGADFVKFRFATKEPNESDTWWFNILCYGRDAKLALDRVKVKDYMQITGRLLSPLANRSDGTAVLLDFKWLKQETTSDTNGSDSTKQDFSFDDFDDIPLIPE